MAKQKESRSVPGDLLKLTNLIDVFMAEIAVLLETQEENEDNFLELNRKTWALRGVYFTARTLMTEDDFAAFIQISGGDLKMILESIADFDITQLSLPNPGN